jgi:LmbE family N-acetylglucosaminyl deacetylase
MIKNKRALVLAPHVDDGEFGCGGTINKLVKDGATVFYIAFSICEPSVPNGFSSDILATEVKDATRVLGILPENVIVHRYPVREFPKYRQEILDVLIQYRNEIAPDLVFLPSSDDIHQDHQVISMEGIRAFKHASILGYEMPWNTINFSASTLVHLAPEQIQTKIDAIACYKSQGHRNYATEDFISSLARVRGTQAGVDYAEAFQAIRWIIR